MRWSPYLEECLEELKKRNEYNTDASLIKYVRMQRMVDRINSSPWFDGTDQSLGWTLYPPALYVRTLRAELEALKKEIQSEFPQDSKLYDAKCASPVLTSAQRYYSGTSLALR